MAGIGPPRIGVSPVLTGHGAGTHRSSRELLRIPARLPDVRRHLLVVTVLLAALAGCGRDSVLESGNPIHPADAPDSVLRISDPSGISLLDTASAQILGRVRDGVRSWD